MKYGVCSHCQTGSILVIGGALTRHSIANIPSLGKCSGSFTKPETVYVSGVPGQVDKIQDSFFQSMMDCLDVLEAV